jgi:hypothetical protein
LAQGVDGVEAGGAPGGQKAEDDADGGAGGEGDAERAEGGAHGPLEGADERHGAGEAERGAGGAAEQRQYDGLDEELQPDVALAGADGHADADLARALGDRDEHDVHDADAADHERDGRDDDEQHREHFVDRFLALAELGHGAHGEVGLLQVVNAVALAQNRLDLPARPVDDARVGGRDDEVVDAARGPRPQARAERADGHEQLVVLVFAERVRPLAREHADDAIRVAPDAHDGADGVLVAEQGLGGRGAEHHDARLGALVLFRPVRAARQRRARHAEVRERGAHDGGRGVLVAVNDLRARVRPRGDGARARRLARHGAAVGLGQPPAAARARARRLVGLREHEEHVRPHALELARDALARAGAERGDDDHRGDADENAEHGERGAHLGPGDGLEGEAHGGGEGLGVRHGVSGLGGGRRGVERGARPGGPAPARGARRAPGAEGRYAGAGPSATSEAAASSGRALRSSLLTSPSRMVTTRAAHAAMSCSWVTSTTVMPASRLRRCSSASTS